MNCVSFAESLPPGQRFADTAGNACCPSADLVHGAPAKAHFPLSYGCPIMKAIKVAVLILWAVAALLFVRGCIPDAAKRGFPLQIDHRTDANGTTA